MDAAGGNDPAQGSGLLHKMLNVDDPGMFRRGRVDDLYLDSFCALVAVYGFGTQIPCLWLSGAMNRWHGAKQDVPPSVGSEALVWLAPGGNYGVILGILNSPGDSTGNRPSTQIANTSIQHDGSSTIHKAKDWGAQSNVIHSSTGLATDTIPGDAIQYNEMGAMTGLLKLLTIIRGTDACKIEAFVLDELMRITGHNYQVRTSAGERTVLCDNGMVDDIEEAAPTLKESMGCPSDQPYTQWLAEKQKADTDPNHSTLDRLTGRWRWRRFRGFLGGMVQRFISKPNKLEGDMDKAASQPATGLSQSIEGFSGLQVSRTVAGVGLHKSPQIAVPQKLRDGDDPAGDHPGVPGERPEFQFAGKNRGFSHMQLRDYFAWLFNRDLPAHFLERSKDWDVPDESNCPVPGQEVVSPGIGGFSREYPEPVEALGPGTGDGSDSDQSALEGRKVVLGDSWIHVLPDGSLHARDIWGTEVSTSGGHLTLSASKDIRLIAGGSIVAMAGHDISLRAKNAFDLSTTEGQVRIKAQKDLFLHAEEGGMLLSLGATWAPFSGDAGEKASIPGIVMKARGSGITIDSSNLTLNLDNTLLLTKGESGNYPSLMCETLQNLFWLKGGGTYFDFNDESYLMLSEGGLYGTGNVMTEGDASFRGGLSANGVSESSDWSGVPPLSGLIGSPFKRKIWDAQQFPLAFQQLSQIQFTFRSVADYGTQQGEWFESAWQREVPGLVEWSEKPAHDGSYPYPGETHYTGQGSFWTYQEINVKTNGRPVMRDNMKPQATEPIAVDWNSIKFSPTHS